MPSRMISTYEKIGMYLSRIISATVVGLGILSTWPATAADRGISAPLAESTKLTAMEKYRMITDKNVFKELEIPDPPAAQQPAALAATGGMGALGKDYELKALIDSGIDIRAGFFDKKANSFFYISRSRGETHDGLELISVNYDKEEAVLRRGVDIFSFSLRSCTPKPTDNTSPTLPESTPRLPDMPMPTFIMPSSGIPGGTACRQFCCGLKCEKRASVRARYFFGKSFECHVGKDRSSLKNGAGASRCQIPKGYG